MRGRAAGAGSLVVVMADDGGERDKELVVVVAGPLTNAMVFY